MTEPVLDLFDDADLDRPVADAVRRLAVAGFHSLWRGETPTLAELAADDLAVVMAATDHLRSGGRMELANDGHLVAIHGLVRRPTRHRIEHAGGAINTWCALDAIGIPAALRIDARALTQCPTCGRDLSVLLNRGEPQPQPELVLWYPPDQCAHLVDDFCSDANLFCTLGHLRQWMGDDSAGRVMTIEEVAEFGRGTWSDVAHEFPIDAGDMRGRSRGAV